MSDESRRDVRIVLAISSFYNSRRDSLLSQEAIEQCVCSVLFLPIVIVPEV
jgi:hypothetical protein